MLPPSGRRFPPYCLDADALAATGRRAARLLGDRGVTELPELLVADDAGWRAWLESHRDASPGVWLVLHKKGGQVTSLTYDQALDEALCFGWIDGQISRRDDGSYRQRFTPRRLRSKWSASNVGRVERLTAAGRMQAAGKAAVEAAKADGRWEAAYAGQAAAELPADLAAAIAANPSATATFETLHPQR
jgi:uncharacterized protein YdeI (YjbR/CyaY-like superfamily)